jgi:hypothetical protein
MLEGINYWDELKDSPSQMETCFAIFVNVLELDEQLTAAVPRNLACRVPQPPRNAGCGLLSVVVGRSVPIHTEGVVAWQLVS